MSRETKIGPRISSRKPGSASSSAASKPCVERLRKVWHESGLSLCFMGSGGFTPPPQRRKAAATWRCGMSENVHSRALQLVAKGRVEGLAQSESDWLCAHLEECDF